MLHQRAQAVAVGGDQHALAVLQRGGDALFPIGEDAGDRVLQAFGLRDGDAGVAAVLAEVVGAAGFERGRGDVEAAAPDVDLLVAVLRRRLRLVETGEAAIMAFVEAPVLFDRQPQPAHRLQREIERLDRPRLQRGEGHVEIEALGRHQLARGARFGRALVGDVDVPPAGEAVFEVPGGLAVADQD